jgi:hypothetical protein
MLYSNCLKVSLENGCDFQDGNGISTYGGKWIQSHGTVLVMMRGLKNIYSLRVGTRTLTGLPPAAATKGNSVFLLIGAK